MPLPVPAAVAVDVAAWLSIQVSAGYLVHRLPDRVFDSDGWLFRERALERGGRSWVALGVRRWKRLLPEAGAVFAGGFDKRALQAFDAAHLAAHLRETRRAELGHWLAMVPTPLFLWWNPPAVAVFMPVYAFAANAPCIVSQRYNRLRLARVLARRSSGS